MDKTVPIIIPEYFYDLVKDKLKNMKEGVHYIIDKHLPEGEIYKIKENNGQNT